MAAQILSGKSLLLPMKGCYRSSSLGHPHTPMRSRTMFCCRASTENIRKFVAKTLHRRPRNMKEFKFTNQDVLRELEDEEADNESIQAIHLNMDDNSLTSEEEEAISKILNPSDNDGEAIENRVLKIKLEQIGFLPS